MREITPKAVGDFPGGEDDSPTARLRRSSYTNTFDRDRLARARLPVAQFFTTRKTSAIAPAVAKSCEPRLHGCCRTCRIAESWALKMSGLTLMSAARRRGVVGSWEGA